MQRKEEWKERLDLVFFSLKESLPSWRERLLLLHSSCITDSLLPSLFLILAYFSLPADDDAVLNDYHIHSLFILLLKDLMSVWLSTFLTVVSFVLEC